MANQKVTTSQNEIKIIIQFNAIYRGVGIVVLAASFYLLLYPVFSGEHIVYRDQLDLTFFSIPGIGMGLLAFLSKRVIFEKARKTVLIEYRTLIFTFYRKIYKYTDSSRLHLSKDSKQLPTYSQPGPNNLFSTHVVPWYLIRLISADNEVLVCKTINANEAKDIANSINRLTNILIEIEEH